MGQWDAWIGREELRTDRIDPAMVARWCATIDRDLMDGADVPQGLHWCLCLPDAATADLGADGHPVRDDGPDSFLPPVPLPRRMWASSKVEFLKPFRLGEKVTRQSKVQSVTAKEGSSGSLVFVDVAHDTFGEDGLAVREVQSLVYRDAAGPDAPLGPPASSESSFDPASWAAHQRLVPSETLLFRFSALTFNSHRIHYDLPYAQTEERYRGLVVHGPLTATLLLDLARQSFGDQAISTFSFRGLSPAMCGEPLHLVMGGPADEIQLAAFADDGRQIMAAQATRA
jgi:3-methylfumaryl-CoA hydratase